MDVYVRAFGARLFSQCLDLRRFANISEGADSVIYRCEFGRQMRGDKKCPMNDEMSKGRVWRTGAGKRELECGSDYECSLFFFSVLFFYLSWEKLKKQRNCAKRICESCQTSLS